MSDEMDDVFEGSLEGGEAAAAADLAADPADAAAPAPAAEGDPAPVEQPEVAQPEAAPTVKPPPGFVPIQALDETRERARRAEEELERRSRAEQPQAPQIPDPITDPEGFEVYQRQRDDSIRWQTLTTTSQMLANQAHGDETVSTAALAFAEEAKQKPWLVQEMRRQTHPYDWVVKRHQRETALATVTPERLAAFQAWEAAQASGQPAPAAASPAPAVIPAASPVPPRSLAAAPAAGAPSSKAAPAGDLMDEVFDT